MDVGVDQKIAMCVTVAEKHPRHSGCIGMFCQLFHWNTRIAKNEKKLLSSGSGIGTHSTYKRFGTQHEPKFHPNVNRSSEGCSRIQQNLEWTPSSPVAKLMGLDSLPAVVTTVKQPNPKHKAKLSHFKSNLMIDEPRLQEQHKTQNFGSHGHVAICGHADSLQLKNMFPCSKKYHHDHQAKLSDPVKFARVRSGNNNAAILVDAASKKFEPGSRDNKSKDDDIRGLSQKVKAQSRQTMIRKIDNVYKHKENNASELVKSRTTRLDGLPSCSSKNQRNTERKYESRGNGEVCTKPLYSAFQMPARPNTENLLLAEVETAAEIIDNAMWLYSIDLPGFKQVESRKILFDLAVEYLTSGLGDNSELGLTIQQLITGLNGEIAKWINVIGYSANKLVEWEVSNSPGILFYYDTEAHKVCGELDQYLLMELLDEIVMEVYESNVQNYQVLQDCLL